MMKGTDVSETQNIQGDCKLKTEKQYKALMDAEGDKS